MDNKILTISIAAYNVENYLDTTLQSLADCKEIHKLDIIVVNDGSCDNTIEIAKRYKERYPNSISIINKKNGGHGSTINVGILAAKGKYFMVLDGDDWTDSTALSNLIKKMEKTDADMILFNKVVCYEKGGKKRLTGCLGFIPDTIYSVTEWNKNVEIALHTACIRTELFKKSELKLLENCFYEDLQYDAYLAYLAKTFVYFDLYVYQYRVGREGQSIQLSKLRENIAMQFKVEKAISKFYYSKCINLPKGQKEVVLNRLVQIQCSIIGTLISIKPNRKTSKMLKHFIICVKNTDSHLYLKERNLVYRILSRIYMYYFVCCLYRFTKRIQE